MVLECIAGPRSECNPSCCGWMSSRWQVVVIRISDLGFGQQPADHKAAVDIQDDV